MTSSEPARNDAAANSIPQIPRLNRTRAVLKVLLVLAVVLPVAFVLWYAWSSYRDARVQVESDVERMVSVAEEHALKVLEINDQINARVIELLRGKSNEQVGARANEYYGLLGEIAESMPQIQSINIFDAAGNRIASSLFARSGPTTNVADREDFYHHARNPESGAFVSQLFQGRTSGAFVFNMSVARRHDGEFLGVVNTSLNPGYFSDYYRQVVAADEGAAIALTHAGGSLIARYPPAPKPTMFTSDDPLQARYIAAERSGTGELRSPVDGKMRYFSFRRIGDSPLYLSASFSKDVWQAAWRRRLLDVAAFTFLPSIALWAMLIVTLKRLKREEEVWDQWRAEVMQRQATELAYKQARRLEALGQLTGGVAHDFNNLLMVVSTSTMILRRQVQPHPGSEQALGALERSIESGKRLTRQLLAFSRKQPQRPEVLDVAEHIREFMDLVRTSLGGRIRLELELGADLKPIYADDAEFELALLNLALNARDAMPEGGRLKISADALTRGYVAIAFEDTGHGIEGQNLERIFEPFFTTKATGRGTGLGLAQVRGFCEEAGGSVTVESQIGVGTVVTMLLPVSDRAVTPAEPAAAQNFAQTSGRVLLVEDNPEVAEATRILLEQLGYTVVVDASGEEAAARLRQDYDWVLVVSDVLMPNGMSGIGLAQTLRVARPKLPMLLITGYTAQLEQATLAGLHVLAKPFDALALRKAIDEALNAMRG